MNALELAQKLAEAREVVDEAIIKHCPVPLFYADKDGRWCRVNEPMERLLALDTEELLATRWLKLLKTGKKEWEYAVKSKQDTTKVYLRFKTVDNRDVAAFASLIRLLNGGFIGFIVPVCDHPAGCPVHAVLLRNVENDGNFTAQVRS